MNVTSPKIFMSNKNITSEMLNSILPSPALGFIFFFFPPGLMGASASAVRFDDVLECRQQRCSKTLAVQLANVQKQLREMYGEGCVVQATRNVSSERHLWVAFATMSGTSVHLLGTDQYLMGQNST